MVRFALWASLLISAASSAVDMNIVWLNSSSHDPLAVCNDGSASAYYFLGATDAALSNTLVFFLQGGGQCYSEETCKNRVPSLMSSKGYTSILSKEGLFDGEAEKSSLWGAAKVFIPYCTSDGWIGDAAPSELTWGYHFRGQRVIRSALNDLISKSIIDANTSIMFGGGSAGARGMMNNVDFLVPLLPTGATVLGAFLDSPFYIDIEPYNANFEGFQYQTNEIYTRYNVSAIIPADCAAAFPVASGEQWKCVYGQYRMAFVHTRYLLVASQFDSYQLSYNVGKEPVKDTYVKDPAANAYAAKWADQTREQLASLTTTSANRNNLFFSWACYNHDVSETSRFYTLTSVGVPQRDAVKALQFPQDHTQALTWIEACDGIFCGVGCDA